MILKGIVEPSEYSESESESIEQGNKIAVLCGDYLLAKACYNLAKLQNTEVDINYMYIFDSKIKKLKKLINLGRWTHVPSYS